MFVAVFYGIFASNELPPLIEKYTIEEESVHHDFGGGIEDILNQYRSILNHSLFSLWIHKNGYPQEVENLFQYRKDLYEFLGKILNDDYFMDVLIPFYLDKAVKNKDDFIDRFIGSNFVAYQPTRYSPEWTSLEFQQKQEKFYREISSSLMRVKSKDELAFDAILKENENGNAEFKSSAFWSKDLSDQEIARILAERKSKELKKYGKNASKFIIAKSIAGLLNSNGGHLIIGICEKKTQNKFEINGIEHELPTIHKKDHTTDRYRLILLEDIIQKYIPDIANIINDYIIIKFLKINEATLCWLSIKQTSKPIFVKIKTLDNEEEKILPVRRDAQTKELHDEKEIAIYIEEHFKS
jgi:hypothetical protein